MKKRLERLFATGKFVSTKSEEDTYYHIPVSDGTWFQIGKSELSDREKLLLESLQTNNLETVDYSNPWQNYLLYNGKQPREQIEKIQCVYLHVNVLEEDLFDQRSFMETLTSALPNSVTWFEMEKTIVILLNQSLFFSVYEQVTDIIQVLEFDFGCQLTIMLGQIWNGYHKHQWGHLLKKESEVFQWYLDKSGKQKTLTLSDLLCWLITESQDLFLYFLEYYNRLISQLEMEDIIFALWEEKGVQTKASKRLFLHRNTLQHRLERFEETTGLDLKNMNDLALAYFAIQKNRF